MSRTVRKKIKSNNSWSNRFKKYDQAYEYYFIGAHGNRPLSSLNYFLKEGWESGWHTDPMMLRRKITKERAFDIWKCEHGESRTANSRTPGKYYRKKREVKLRSHNKRELVKFVSKEDYEPMCKNNPDSHYWDWA